MLNDLYSPLWAIPVVAAAFALAATPIFKWADANAAVGAREMTIDGLRGFLALSVFLHHAAIYHDYAVNGPWQAPPSLFFSAAGPVGVAIFFMITAYLFWGRILRGGMDWLAFYIGRVFRIGPLYLVAAVFVLAITAFATGSLQLMPTIKWLGLGALGAPAINGFEAKRLLAGVTWTLLWEWRFYILLAPMALFRRLHWLVGALGLAVSLALLLQHPSSEPTIPAIGSFFSVGMLCASAKHSGLKIYVPRWLLSLACLASLGVAVFLIDKSYSVSVVLLAAIAFFAVERGADIFGLLVHQASIRLGNLSYGIYLLHGLVLFAAFSIPRVEFLTHISPLTYWTSVTFIGLGVTLLSLTLHRPVEIAGISLGRQVVARIKHLRGAAFQPASKPS